MRWLFSFLVPGLIAALLAPAVSGKDVAKAPAPTCGEYGTSVHFEANPSAAARKALKEEKLVCVLHISGLFEDPEFTENNAEALRVNALASPEVGKYFEENFVCAFQKVGTFRIVGKQKQGGNVATYFCAPDGRVLHAVAGPVDAATLLRESKWVVETARQAIKDSKGDGREFKAIFRQAHASKLRAESGLVVQPVSYDPPDPKDQGGALTYRDPTGQPLAPVLPPPPIDGPDVKLRLVQEKLAAGGAMPMSDRLGRRWALDNQGRVHMLLAGHAMVKIEEVYGSIFEGILGERISTRPVEVVNPFPWHGRKTVGN